MHDTQTIEALSAENAALRRMLEEPEQIIAAIRNHAVDAFIVEQPDGQRVYTLEDADGPYRRMVECMQEGALTLSADGTVLYCNARLADLLAQPRESVIGRPLDAYVTAGERSVLQALLREAVHDVRRTEAALCRADGTAVPVQITASPLALRGAVGLCAVVTDLTERKQIERLQRMEEALRDSDRRKDEFLATLAHELRNPLAPIRNAVQILNAPDAPEPALQSARDIIDRQLDHMVRLIDDLLDASRIGSGKLELRRQRVALAAIVEQALETSRPHVERAAHELTVSLPAQPIHLDVDPTRLAQAFANLVHNACKYTAERGRIWLTAARDGADVVVRVKDSGIGIATEHLPRVFEMFAQVDSAPERSQGGLGVGLALVRGLVELHGGSVAAHSAGVGQGSEFTVRLPALPEGAESHASTAQAAAAGAATTARRILVVDDNRDNAESLALLLRLGGNEVETAHDGVEALAAAERVRPDVVLLDLAMPNLDGYEVCRRIRAHAWGRRTILLALTGWGGDDDHQRTEAAGFDGHLVKPVDVTQVLAMLDRRFGRSRH